jgi:hypothetical protein
MVEYKCQTLTAYLEEIQMDVKVGKDVSVRHYSKSVKYNSLLIKQEKDEITLKLLNDYAIFKFMNGDPVAIGFEQDRILYVASCIVSKTNCNKNEIRLTMREVQIIENKRKQERFPVSFYVDIKNTISNKRFAAFAGNISIDYILFHCKEEVNIGDKLEIMIPTNKKDILLETTVTKKDELEHNFEYVVMIDYKDNNEIKEQINTYIEFLSQEKDISIIV